MVPLGDSHPTSPRLLCNTEDTPNRRAAPLPPRTPRPGGREQPQEPGPPPHPSRGAPKRSGHGHSPPSASSRGETGASPFTAGSRRSRPAPPSRVQRASKALSACWGSPSLSLAAVHRPGWGAGGPRGLGTARFRPQPALRHKEGQPGGAAPARVGGKVTARFSLNAPVCGRHLIARCFEQMAGEGRAAPGGFAGLRESQCGEPAGSARPPAPRPLQKPGRPDLERALPGAASERAWRVAEARPPFVQDARGARFWNRPEASVLRSRRSQQM